MKVLLSAYSCLPGGGSEPGIGWNWTQAIADSDNEVVTITRGVNQAAIEKYNTQHPMERARFVYHDLSPLVQRIYKFPFGNYAYYFLWQLTAANLARELHSTEKFDWVQHITWGSFRVPSFLGKLGIPFIFGPVGGGEDTPRNLRRGLGWKGRLWDALRRISGTALGVSMGATYRSAFAIVATTEETRQKIPKKYRDKTRVQQAVGLDPSQIPVNAIAHSSDTIKKTSKLELLFVGRLLAWKGIHLILKALTVLGKDNDDFHLTIIGSGKDHSRLRKMSEKLGISGLITWISWLPREELIRKYPEFDVFVFPSLHDSGGTAVLEAMAFGLPVICLDLGGPSMAVNDQCGRVIRTEGLSENEVVKALAQHLAELNDDRTILARLSETAKSRITAFSWKANVKAVYDNLR